MIDLACAFVQVGILLTQKVWQPVFDRRLRQRAANVRFKNEMLRSSALCSSFQSPRLGQQSKDSLSDKSLHLSREGINNMLALHVSETEFGHGPPS